MLNKKTKHILILIIITSLLSISSGCDMLSSILEVDIPEGTLKVHFIDVGQGDAILIQEKNSAMMIDAGDNQYEDLVVEYLKKNGIKKLDYIIGTHPHADHIGGLDAVIKNFDIENIIMPKVDHNTKTFEDVLLEVKKKGLKISSPKIRESYTLGESNWTILAPNSKEYSNLNNYSIAVKLDHGENSFLFTGDAEDLSEREMLEQDKRLLKSDVFKAGHHGSSSSNGEEFLDAVNPKVVVIQSGKDNKYGHPHKEVMESLEKRNIKILRNDIDGDIVLISDGETINAELGKTSNISPKKDEKSLRYIGNKNSKVYHLENCNQLPKEKNRIHFSDKKEAEKNDYKPCSRCKP